MPSIVKVLLTFVAKMSLVVYLTLHFVSNEATNQ